MANPQLSKMFGAGSPINPLVVEKEKALEKSQIVPSDYLDYAPVTPVVNSAGISHQDELQDVDYARRTLLFTIERSQQLVDLALSNAADGSSPRDIEVAANALNTCANLSDKLVDMHNKLSSNKKQTDMGTGNTFVNNNKTIVLTSSELLRQLTDDDNTKEMILEG